MRITIGKKWETQYVAVYKSTIFKHFSKFEFNRGTETHYSKNVVLFPDDIQGGGVNLKMTLGLALDKQTDVTDINEDELQPYLTDYIMFPPSCYYNKDISMNIMP